MGKQMKRYCVVCMLFVFLVGCNGSKDVAESQEPPSQAPVEATQQELYQRFELVYDDCGGSFSDDAEQISAELAALKAKAQSDEKMWPQDYETFYKSWRANTIEERTTTLQKEYEEVISGRELYEIGVDGLWETTPGLIYANYIDIGQDEKPELMLLTWRRTDYGTATLMEVYGDERGHSTKYFEQNLDFPIGIMDISLMESSDGTEFVAVSAEDGGSGQSTLMNVFYAIEKDGLSIADVVFDYWYRDYSTDEGTTVYSTLALDDTFALGLEPNIQLWGSSGESSSGLDMEIEQEEYDSILAKYTGNTLLFMSPYSEPQIHNTGLLPAFEVAVPQVEVNGKILDLEVAPYVYNGELMVPLCDVLEAMGVAVYTKIEAPREAIFASTKNDSLRIANYPPIYGEGEIYNDIGSISGWVGETWGDLYNPSGNEYFSYFNGGEKTKITIEKKKGKSFAPISVFSFFGNAEWDNENRMLIVSSNIASDIQISQSDLQKIADFSFEEAEELGYRKGYQRGTPSDGSFCAEFQVAFGASNWRYDAMTTSHTTYGKMIVHNDGAFK